MYQADIRNDLLTSLHAKWSVKDPNKNIAVANSHKILATKKKITVEVHKQHAPDFLMSPPTDPQVPKMIPSKYKPKIKLMEKSMV